MIKAREINKDFRQGGRTLFAVKDADLTISKGERIYIHGPSGAGKSTLLQMLGGLLKPTSGTVEFSGKDIYSMPGSRRSRLMNVSFGFVFQFYHLLPELTVLENVMLPAMIKGGESSRSMRARAMELVDRVSLSARASHRPSRISGGEAQRTAIARALMNAPEVLFCDEPAGNLDSAMSEEIYALIKEISDERHMSVVIVSHQTVSEDMFHSEYLMKDGRLREHTGCAV